MTEVVKVADAKTNLSALLKRVESGEEFVIARGDQQIARLVPAEPAPERELGFVAALVPDGFDDPLPEAELAAWEGQ